MGKSFYNDPYFKGSFDNVNVWNRALTAQEVEKTSPIALQGISVGTVPSDPNSLRGTDDHSQVRSTLDWSTKTVTTVLNRRGGATKVPVKVSVNRSDDSIKLTLDGQAFTNGGTADLAKDRTLVVDLGDGAPQTWTLKKVTVATTRYCPASTPTRTSTTSTASSGSTRPPTASPAGAATTSMRSAPPTW